MSDQPRSAHTPLEQVLIDARSDADVLDRHGQAKQANAIRDVCDKVQEAAEDYMRFIPEPDAIIRSGQKVRWWRARRLQFERDGHAMQIGSVWHYRLMAVPTRARLAFARQSGRDAAQAGAKKTA